MATKSKSAAIGRDVILAKTSLLDDSVLPYQIHLHCWKRLPRHRCSGAVGAEGGSSGVITL